MSQSQTTIQPMEPEETDKSRHSHTQVSLSLPPSLPPLSLSLSSRNFKFHLLVDIVESCTLNVSIYYWQLQTNFVAKPDR